MNTEKNIEQHEFSVLIKITETENEVSGVEFSLNIPAENESTAYSIASELIENEYGYPANTHSRFEDSIIQNSKDVLTFDADTTAEDEKDDDGQGSVYPYDINGFDLDLIEAPSSIYEYIRQLDKGKIDTEPDFQRNLVWKKNQKSQFIESILLNFPLPPIYLNQRRDGKLAIIDGLQRTTTLNSFMKDEFALSDLKVLTRLNKTKDKEYRFSTLTLEEQARIEDKKLQTLILKPSTPPEVIYDLFNRINTGGTQLNRQEIRHCLFIGKSTILLKKLAEEKVFALAVDNSIRGVRMKDRECILRYLAFRWQDYSAEYKGDMSKFLENMMQKINSLHENKIEEYVKDFKKVMDLSLFFFGKENFRIPKQNGRGLVNIAILESVCNYLSYYRPEPTQVNKDILYKNYIKLIHDVEYVDAVTKSTSNRKRVLIRFQRAIDILSQGVR